MLFITEYIDLYVLRSFSVTCVVVQCSFMAMLTIDHASNMCRSSISLCSGVSFASYTVFSYCVLVVSFMNVLAFLQLSFTTKTPLSKYFCFYFVPVSFGCSSFGGTYITQLGFWHVPSALTTFRQKMHRFFTMFITPLIMIELKH